jgi:hypothetical protein
MKTTALINVNFDSELKKAGIGRTTLKPGDVLRVRVLEIVGDQRVRADFGKFRANAEITFPVNRGQELMVKVVEIGQQLRFSVIQPGPSSGNIADSFFDSLKFLSNEQFQQIRSEFQQVYDQISGFKDSQILPQSVVRAFTQIQGHFSTLMIQDNISRLASELKNYIDHSGIFFESKIKDALASLIEDSQQLALKNIKQSPDIKEIFVKDLKPNLLLLRDFLESRFESRTALAGSEKLQNPAQIKSAVDSLLTEIESQQKLVVKKQIQPDPFQVLTFLLPLKEKNQNAKIKFYYPKKQKDEAKNEFRISLLLNMDRMGEIRTDLIQRDKELNITFFVKDERNKNTLENNYAEIRSVLDHLFEYIVLRTVIYTKKIDDFQREDWVLSEDRRVDVRI